MKENERTKAGADDCEHQRIPTMWPYVKRYLFILVLVKQTIVNVEAHREHKVHNIVLYPDKHSWCKTTTIKQVISYPGCKSETIDNNVCVGTCFSYSIPLTEPSNPGESIIPYCDSCQPSETMWRHVTLQCDRNDPDTPPQLIKRVQIIQNCSCTSCEKDRSKLHRFGSLDSDSDMMTQQSDTPDLLHALQTRNESSTQHRSDPERSNQMKDLMNHKIITLLKNIQANNSQDGKEQLMDLLRIVQGPNQKISDKSIADFVDSMHAENIELDITRLKEILVKFEHSKYYKKHKSEGENEDDKEEEEKKGMEKHHHHHQGNEELQQEIIAAEEKDEKDETPVMMPFDGLEGSRAGLEHSHLKGAHVGMGLHQLLAPIAPIVSATVLPSLSSDAEDEDAFIRSMLPKSEELDAAAAPAVDSEEDSSSVAPSSIALTSSTHPSQHYQQPPHIGSVVGVLSGVASSEVLKEPMTEPTEDRPTDVATGPSSSSSGTLHSQHHHASSHHHHQVGESIPGHAGLLARGPHGALVIEPNRVHEKLDVNPHELKPNHAGTLLSYHSHSASESAASKNLD